MNDVFLYNHIKQAIKQRKQFSKDTEEQNFAESYCRRQLIKKKLNCNTSKSSTKNKMKSLMKNFTHVETYVDLNQLLYSINLIRTKQLSQRKITAIQQKQRMSRISRINDFSNLNKLPLSNFSQDTSTPVIDPIEALKDRFRGQINERIKRKYQADNSEMNQIVKYFEKQSHLSNSLLKNNSTNYLSYMNQELERIQKNDEIDGDSSPQNWKIFRQLTQSMGQSSFEKQPRTQYFKSTNLNSKQKKEENQLLHKISTFLQIALENQHKEKWATKDIKKFRSTHGSFRFKKGKDQRSKFFLKGIEMQNENKEKQFFENIHQNPNSSSVSKKSTVRRNQNFMKKIKSQQRNIFGKKILEHENRAMNQTGISMKTASDWKVPQTKKRDTKQNPNLFKMWDKNNVLEQRKTAPVNHNNILGDFTLTMSNGFNKNSNDKEEQNERTDVFLTDVQPKKQFLLSKKKQSRGQTFVTPNRKAGHSKTFVVGSSRNSETGDEIRQILKQEQFLQVQDLTSIIRNQPSHTQALQKVTKLSSVASDPSLKTQINFKKSASQKTNLLSQTFTFKKRGRKQQIINKLQSFIDEINNQQKMSKMQNEYYNSAINRLRDLSKTTYRNYEPEALAGYEQISELKKFVNAINPSLRKNKSKKRTVMR